jgi:hypothetical protein
MKDPAFLFYSSDFLSGCIGLDMEERGQYITLLCAQHQKGHLSEKTIRLLVGSVSVNVLVKFSKDEDGNYFSIRLDSEIEKRKNFTESRRLNGQKGGRKASGLPNAKPNAIPRNNHTENENINANEDEILIEYENWTKSILEGNDQYFEQMFMNERIPAGDHIQYWVLDHRDMLNRYPKMRPPTQHAFRKSCIKHIRENYKKPINGTVTGINKKQQQTDDLIISHAKRWGNNPSQGT